MYAARAGFEDPRLYPDSVGTETPVYWPGDLKPSLDESGIALATILAVLDEFRPFPEVTRDVPELPWDPDALLLPDAIP